MRRGYKLTEEHKQKISESKKGAKYNINNRTTIIQPEWTKETKLAILDAELAEIRGSKGYEELRLKLLSIGKTK